MFLQNIALANHATSFNVVLHPFAIEFKPTQQALLIVGDVHGRVANFFSLSPPFKYHIKSLFFYLLLTGIFIYGSCLTGYWVLLAFFQNAIVARVPEL